MLGFALLAASVVIMYAWDHHLTSVFPSEMAFERVFFYLQLSGLLIAAVGSVGLLLKLTRKAAVYTGIALLLFVSVLLLSVRYPTDILSLHTWKISWFVPLTLSALVGLALLLFGGRRKAKQPLPH